MPITDQHHTESNAPFVKDRGPKRGMYNQIEEKVVCGGGKRYVTNVCMYAALFRLYYGIITQTARRRARRRSHGRRCRRRRESVPRGPVSNRFSKNCAQRENHACKRPHWPKPPIGFHGSIILPQCTHYDDPNRCDEFRIFHSGHSATCRMITRLAAGPLR